MHFAAFMAVNAFTSFNIAEACNWQATRYHAAAFNNTEELEHRSDMQEKLRKSLFKRVSNAQ